MPSDRKAAGKAASILRMDGALLDSKDGGALEDAARQVMEVGRRDQRLGPGLQGGQQALPPRRIELGHDVVEQEHRLLSSDLGKVVEFRQLQAQDGTALLSLAGIESRLVFIQPHLDIVALRSDSCLSTRDLFIAGFPHGGFQLLGDELGRRFTDARSRRPVAQVEPLTVVAQLAMEGGRDRMEVEQPALPLDHDDRARLGERRGPVVETVDRLPAFAHRAEQRIALLEEMAVAIEFAGMSTVELREQGIEEAATALTGPFDELQVIRPEEHDA